ncbi:hypothetical protein Pcar_3051 [Syntrophotalea carbinolica DSM 2380]|uniref:Uncharacterized protein n=1 Tax=Syntrophotalea carbinolica (strain DSM 2380 / NBRC 103641 / GraBd1) TaxID=338963 RepID=Q3A021_SYNC1|nr:hypothetical protein [Syntrophotalea carbinolica]ABA90286.1 hypothetical protein Pcar_3051 [Syntrophotalea carbinolica DSM 2380]
MFGFFKKKYPLLKNEMITPVGEPVNTSEAKRIFKQFMKEIGYLEKDELTEHAGYLSEEIKDHEQGLREECLDKKEEIAEAKRLLKELKSNLKKAEGEEKEDIECEIEDIEDDLEDFVKELEQAAEALAKFKKDKREFLIEYINNQTQSR